MVTGAAPVNFKIGDTVLEKAFHDVLRLVRAAGGRVVVVGGAVRDAMLGCAAKDLDLEIYHLQPSQLLAVLRRDFDIDQVGMAFGVLKLHGVDMDISIPRRESKAGMGHKGFEIFSDPFMDFEAAASRRDFTINAIGLDPSTWIPLDPFHGIKDLRQKVLRHTSPSFSEDPLRVLRGMQLAARFDLAVAPETVSLCSNITSEGLARERVFDEWKKLLLQGRFISRGLRFLKECGWVRYFPELAAMIGCPQDSRWHPEGDVWAHTLHCLDAFAGQRIGKDEEDLVVGLAVLCHDIGKPATTVERDGVIRSPGHDVAGAEPTRAFLSRLTNQTSLIEDVVRLVMEHMRPQDLYDAQASPAAIRRLAARVGRIDRLLRVAHADRMGRPPMSGGEFLAAEWLLQRAREDDVERSAPPPIVLGRHLIELGLRPGPAFSPLLEACYQAQLEGEFRTLDEGVRWVSKRLSSLP